MTELKTSSADPLTPNIINGAKINASDMPHTVVEKLRASFAASPRFQQTYCQRCSCKCGPGDDGPIDCGGHAKGAGDHSPKAGKMIQSLAPPDTGNVGALLDEMRAFINLLKGAAILGPSTFTPERCRQIFEECARLNGRYLELDAGAALPPPGRGMVPMTEEIPLRVNQLIGHARRLQGFANRLETTNALLSKEVRTVAYDVEKTAQGIYDSLGDHGIKEGS